MTVGFGVEVPVAAVKLHKGDVVVCVYHNVSLLVFLRGLEGLGLAPWYILAFDLDYDIS